MTLSQRMLAAHFNGDSRWRVVVVGNRINAETGVEEVIVLAGPEDGESARYVIPLDAVINLDATRKQPPEA